MEKMPKWLVPGFLVLAVIVGILVLKPSVLGLSVSDVSDNGGNGGNGGTISPGFFIEGAMGVRTRTNDIFSPGSNQDVLTLLYDTDGNLVDNADDEGNLDASPQTDYVVIAYDDASTNADGSNDWYGQIIQINTDLKDPYDVIFALYKEGSPSAWTYDSAGSAQSATANYESIGNDEVVELKLTVRAPNDASFGDPYSTGDNAELLACFNYNATAFDSVKVDGGTKASVPGFDVATSEECWTLGVNALKDTENSREEKSWVVLIDSDATQGPVNENITVRLMDTAFYVDANTGAYLFGVEDEDGNDVGVAATTDATFYIV